MLVDDLTLSSRTLLMDFGAITAVAFLGDVHLDADCMDLMTGRVKYCSPWAHRDCFHWCLASVTPLIEAVPCRARWACGSYPPTWTRSCEPA